MLLFLLGAAAGVLVMLRSLWRAKRTTEILEEEKQRMADEKQIVVDFMHDMVEAVGEGLSREDLFQRIVHAAILSTGALSACLFEKTPDNKLRGVAVEGLFPPQKPMPRASLSALNTRARFIEQVLKSETLLFSDGAIGECAQSQNAILIADATVDPRIIRHEDPALVIRSLMVAPIAFRDRLIGVLAVANSADGLPFTEMDLSLVQSLAEQSALAIHNAEFIHFQLEKKRLDVDLALASNIQHMLLPDSSPVLPELDIDARYLPSQQVSGDLFDIFPIDDNRVGVAVADVSGKGIPASLLMAICRTNLRLLGPLHESPSKALIALNRAMEGQLNESLYITILYAVIDPRKGNLTFARAGHELPIFVRWDVSAGIFRSEIVGSEGMPLGMVDSELFESVITDKVEPFGWGDVCVLYTDGVTEAPNEENKEYTAQRLADLVTSLRNFKAKDINDGILDALDRFAGPELHRDDLTLITIKRA